MQKQIAELEKYILYTKQYMVENITEMLPQELPIMTAEKFALFQESGNRLAYERDYFSKRKFLTVFGVAAQWMKQEQVTVWEIVTYEAVLKKLEKILFSICGEECWALPAHVNMNDRNWQNTIDLFAAETAQALADIVDGLETDLSSQCVALVREHVERRVLHPFFQSKPHTYGWENCENNWNAVCNGNIGSAYLHSLTLDDQPNPQYIKRISDNLLHYIDGLAEDGTCMEGVGYYFYGMTYWVNFAKEFYEKTEGKQDLLKGTWGDFQGGMGDKRERIAQWFSKCFFAFGRTVSFSDGDSREKYRMGLACALAEQFPAVQLPEVKQAMLLEDDPCYRYVPFKMDLFCTIHYVEQLKKTVNKLPNLTDTTSQLCKSRITILPKAQWCIGENLMSKIGFACKGGNNDEPHNHNDVGSFLYVSGKDMFLTDLGAGEYTKEYFGDGRYDILCNRSLGHNVPLIAGMEQLTGSVYACAAFEPHRDGAKLYITMDLTKAYGKSALKNFTRRICFEEETGILIVEDTFACEKKLTITENLVTQLPPQIEGDSILLCGERVCCIQIMSDAEKTNEPPYILSMEHRNHQGEKEQVYLIQWNRVVQQYHKECFKVEILK